MAYDINRHEIDMCDADEDADEGRGNGLQVVVFRVEAEWLALPARALDEVVSMRPIHSLPHRRTSVILGVVNVRGGLLACMTLARLLRIPATDMPSPVGLTAASGSTARPARLLVLRSQPLNVALYADEVDGVHTLNMRRLKAVPSTLAGAAAQHTVGWGRCGERHVGLLDETAVQAAIQRGFI